MIQVPAGDSGLEGQREIAAILEQADTRIRRCGPVIAALQQLKQSLMHDLLTGKVRVGEAGLDPAA